MKKCIDKHRTTGPVSRRCIGSQAHTTKARGRQPLLQPGTLPGPAYIFALAFLTGQDHHEDQVLPLEQSDQATPLRSHGTRPRIRSFPHVVTYPRQASFQTWPIPLPTTPVCPEERVSTKDCLVKCFPSYTIYLVILASLLVIKNK